MMASQCATSNAESFDQLLWELQVLDENWAMRNPLRFLVYERRRPDTEALKRYACYGMIIINIMLWLFLPTILGDPRAGLVVAFASLFAAVTYYFTVRSMRSNEFDFLHQRKELMSRLRTVLNKESPNRRSESLENLWQVEERHLLHDKLFLLLPWEQQIGSGRYLIVCWGILSLALLIIEPISAFYSLVPLVFGLARFREWRKLRNLRREFLNLFSMS